MACQHFRKSHHAREVGHRKGTCSEMAIVMAAFEQAHPDKAETFGLRFKTDGYHSSSSTFDNNRGYHSKSY